MSRRRSIWAGYLVLVLFPSACGAPAVSEMAAPAGPSPVARVAPAATPDVPLPTPTPRVHRTVATAAPPSAGVKPVAGVATALAPAAAKPVKAPPAAPDAAAQLLQVQAAMAALTSYRMQVSGTDARKDGSLTTRTQVGITYQAPGDYRFDVQTSTIALAVGSHTIFHTGGSTVQAKAGGILGLVTLTLPLTDSKVVSANNWTYDKLLMHAVVDRAISGGGTVSAAGTATLGGDALTVLKVATPANALDPDIAYELIGYDAGHHVRLWACYAGAGIKAASGLLYQSAIEQFTANPAVPDGTFKL